MECIGVQLRFWVNGELLADIPDSALAEGDIPLGVVSLDGEYSDVTFENLVVTAPAPR